MFVAAFLTDGVNLLWLKDPAVPADVREVDIETAKNKQGVSR